jgi:hypothetical protein
MKRSVMCAAAVALVVAVLAAPLRAQLAVFDPANYIEAILEVEQLIKEYEFLIDQARRIPGMASRYHAFTPSWPMHNAGAVVYAAPLLDALNNGDSIGAGYRSMADALDSFPSWRIPAALRSPLATQYANIELADSIATMGIDQVGKMRETTNLILQLIGVIEADAYSTDDRLQTQSAILNKINAADVVGVRVGIQNHELLGDTLEQLIIENKVRRDAETRHMNAVIYQWQFGASYGQDLFSRTAADVDAWRPF